MRRLRNCTLVVSLGVSLLFANASFAATRDGDGSLFDHITSKIRSFIIHILDDSGAGIPPGSH
jgi:hypothetical protein